MEIFGIRIWPRPRWPLIHRARWIYRSGGGEAFRAWAEKLSDKEKRQFHEEIINLLETAAEKVIKDIQEGKIEP